MISKSTGVTETERMLAEFCERSFLKLWSYPNPFKDDGHELCDLLAVFGNNVFIFFDRENALPATSEKDPQILWDRWKRNVIDRQVRTAHGAERYIRSKRPIFLDAKGTAPFPLEIEVDDLKIHKIVVAHGAKVACEQASETNIYGSLAITYCSPTGRETTPFHVEIDKSSPVNIFDSHNFSIVLSELDTVTDFSNYLVEKLRAIARYDYLSYCGEEDLLGHYLLNFNKREKRHVIGAQGDGVNGILIGEGEWHDFITTDLYKNTKNEDCVSYFWDKLIQRTCQNSLDGTLGGNADLLRGASAIFEMVKEPRFMRRGISERIMRTVANFPDGPGLTRQVSFIPSFSPDAGYVFFQLRAPETIRGQPDYLDKRRTLLEIACGAAKNKFPHLKKVIGIGIDAPKFAGGTNSEDFILLNCEDWSSADEAEYKERNVEWNFFNTAQVKQYQERITQFVRPGAKQPAGGGVKRKIGRNEPCSCGSGLKFKRCHGRSIA